MYPYDDDNTCGTDHDNNRPLRESNTGAISFDSDTGIVEVYEPEDGPSGSGPLIKREKFHPEAICVVDNHKLDKNY